MSAPHEALKAQLAKDAKHLIGFRDEKDKVIAFGKDPKTGLLMERKYERARDRLVNVFQYLYGLPQEAVVFSAKEEEPGKEPDQTLPEMIICKDTKGVFIPSFPEKKRKHILTGAVRWSSFLFFAENAGKGVTGDQIREALATKEKPSSFVAPAQEVGNLRQLFEVDDTRPTLFRTTSNRGNRGAVYDLKAQPRFVSREEWEGYKSGSPVSAEVEPAPSTSPRVIFNPQSRQIAVLEIGGRVRTLSSDEVNVLEILRQNQNGLSSRKVEDLMQARLLGLEALRAGQYISSLRQKIDKNPKAPRVVIRSGSKMDSSYRLGLNVEAVEQAEWEKELKKFVVRRGSIVGKSERLLLQKPAQPKTLEQSGADAGEWLQEILAKIPKGKEEFSLVDLASYTGRTQLNVGQQTRVRELITASGGNGNVRGPRFGKDVLIQALKLVGLVNPNVAEARSREAKTRAQARRGGITPIAPERSAPPAIPGQFLASRTRVPIPVFLRGQTPAASRSDERLSLVHAETTHEFSLNQPLKVLRLANILLSGGIEVYAEITGEEASDDDRRRIAQIAKKITDQGLELSQVGDLALLDLRIEKDLEYFQTHTKEIIEQHKGDEDFLFVLSYFAPQKDRLSAVDIFRAIKVRVLYNNEHRNGSEQKDTNGGIEWHKGEHTLKPKLVGILADLMLDPTKGWLLGRANLRPTPAELEEWRDIRESFIKNGTIIKSRDEKDLEFANDYPELRGQLAFFTKDPDAFFAKWI